MRAHNRVIPNRARVMLWPVTFVTPLLAALLWACSADAAPAPSRVFYGVGGVEIQGSGLNLLSLGIGVYNFNQRGPAQHNQISALGHVEVRLGQKLGFVGPAAGIMANADGGVFGYAGGYVDVRYRQFILTPLLAIGGYRQGNSKDLGGIFQFFLSMTLSYQFTNASRLGIRFSHISNGGLHRRNPGEQALMLAYATPF